MNFDGGLIDTGTWVLRTSIEASVFLLIIGLLLVLGKPLISPRFRVVLWSVVGFRFLLPVAPESSISLFRAVPEIPAFSETAATKRTEPFQWGGHPERNRADSPMTEQETGEFSGKGAISLFSIIWIVGVIGIFSVAILRQRRTHRQIRQWPAVGDPALIALVHESGISQSVAVVERPYGGGIGVFGFVRATHLILPADMRTRYTEGQIRGILRHEAEHIRRRDLAWNWILFLIQALHWFNPLVWLAGRQLRNDREILCDDAALRREPVEVRRDYGSALIRAIEFDRLPAAQVALLPFLSRKDEMKQRLNQIMKNPTYSTVPQIGVALLALAAVIVTFTSAVPPVGAADEKPDGAAEEGKKENPERNRDVAKPEAEAGAKRKDGEGDKGKGAAKEGDKPGAAGANKNSQEREVFDGYDKDDDGVVTAKEMEAMLEGKQNSSGRRQIRKAIERSDSNADEKLNFEEFLFWYKVGRLDEKAENR